MFRVVWRRKSMGSKLRFTVWYGTQLDAERMAQSILRGGDHVVSIECQQ